MEFVASPRHADGLVLTGPISASMASAVNETYNAIPEPRIIILTGACAISGGLFVDSPAIDRTFLKDRKIDLYVPGCPIHPLTFINGVMSLIGR
jgi:Ni,Fe-hydrogenase III small subunit